jgi:KaiC/GvpD/RAD55 family RecA-like ATPase
MQDAIKRANPGKEPPLDLSVEGLKGRQSVRATFNLPEEMIELFSLVAGQFGLKQKSLFDQLVENSETLGRVAEEAGEHRRRKDGRRAKTLVVSKRSLELLEMVARERNVPRDVLVELSLRRLLPLLQQEQQRHSRRVVVSSAAMKFHRQAEKLLRQVEDRLGRDDQVYQLVASMVAKCQETSCRLQEIVAKGEPVLRYRNEER